MCAELHVGMSMRTMIAREVRREVNGIQNHNIPDEGDAYSGIGREWLFWWYPLKTHHRAGLPTHSKRGSFPSKEHQSSVVKKVGASDYPGSDAVTCSTLLRTSSLARSWPAGVPLHIME